MSDKYKPPDDLCVLWGIWGVSGIGVGTRSSSLEGLGNAVKQTRWCSLNGNRVVQLVDTYESRWIVITGCLGVTVGFQYGVSLDNLILETSLLGLEIVSEGNLGMGFFDIFGKERKKKMNIVLRFCIYTLHGHVFIILQWYICSFLR